MTRRKLKHSPPIVEYRDRFICRAGDVWRVKVSPNDRLAIHHESFDSVLAAKSWIDCCIDGDCLCASFNK